MLSFHDELHDEEFIHDDPLHDEAEPDHDEVFIHEEPLQLLLLVHELFQLAIHYYSVHYQPSGYPSHEFDHS